MINIVKYSQHRNQWIVGDTSTSISHGSNSEASLESSSFESEPGSDSEEDPFMYEPVTGSTDDDSGENTGFSEDTSPRLLYLDWYECSCTTKIEYSKVFFTGARVAIV